MNRAFSLLGVALFAMHANVASADTDLRNVVRSNNGNIAKNSFGNCVRSNFHDDADACGPAPAAAAPARMTIAQDERSVYFDFDKATLTDEARAKLDSLAGKLTSDDQVKRANISGYADRIGTRSYNEQLSKKRAETVRRYLVSRGFIKGQVAQTKWLGESVPVTQCPDDLSREALIQCLQQDRRVEVEIEYQK